MKRYPDDYIWAMALWPFYLAAHTATHIAEAIAGSLERE